VRIVLGLIAVLFAIPTFAQQHAPTAEVCKADVAVWYNAEMATEYYKAQQALVEDTAPNRTDIAKLPVQEVIARMNEMYDCARADVPEGVDPQTNRYFQAGHFYHEVFSSRAMQFIHRHGLWDEFLKEDSSGKR
jgi:hypothetical protein